ncbi:MAG TPA: endolytic transglycosylase MltG [Saprospiraceae bacterium]|nr:endolytic transglycosylase MltG [Saprospiraceae bacterium]HPI07634.1 endolytic transglycosylase MltG [Saprospiraceae bacterium]
MKFIKSPFVLLLIFLFGAAGVSFWIYRTLNAPVRHTKSSEFIEIPKGSTPNQIITKLAAEGILKSEMATRIYLRTSGGAEKLKAGEYRFDSPITALQVLKLVEKGAERTTKITIPEGFTRFDIAARIAERFPQPPPVDEKAILAMMDDVTLIKDIAPDAPNLEGYIYPTTYNLPHDMPAEKVIAVMVGEFKKIWKDEWTAQAKSLGRTPREIVTIASLIETESKVDDERPLVASVIYNRLKRNVPLALDQTAVYIAKMEHRWDGTINKSDLEVDSPYNTRKSSGIPPGPISSPSESAIVAALHPAQTNYIYYVLNVEKNDGSHHFYASASEFEKGKAAYQTWLAKKGR